MEESRFCNKQKRHAPFQYFGHTVYDYDTNVYIHRKLKEKQREREGERKGAKNRYSCPMYYKHI